VYVGVHSVSDQMADAGVLILAPATTEHQMIIPRISRANFNTMLQEPGKHSRGAGLMLLVRAPGKASYSMRY